MIKLKRKFQKMVCLTKSIFFSPAHFIFLELIFVFSVLAQCVFLFHFSSSLWSSGFLSVIFTFFCMSVLVVSFSMDFVSALSSSKKRLTGCRYTRSCYRACECALRRHSLKLKDFQIEIRDSLLPFKGPSR